MPEAKRNIVWLASYPKSGNTWFRVFLSNLFSDSSQAIHINDLTETTISSNRSVIDSYLGIHSSELTAEEIDVLRPQVFRRFSDEEEGTAYIKTHEAWTLNSKGHPLFAEEITKGVIYIIRNPLDIAISFSYHNNETIDNTISILNDDFSKLCEEKDKLYIQTQQLLKSWSNHVISWTKESKLPVHIIRYEDILDDPFNSFKNAVDYLDLQYEDEEIRKAITNSSFDTLKKMEAKDGFKERGMHSEAFFRKGKSNDWESGLSLTQTREIVLRHNKIMKQFAYLE